MAFKKHTHKALRQIDYIKPHFFDATRGGRSKSMFVSNNLKQHEFFSILYMVYRFLIAHLAVERKYYMDAHIPFERPQRRGA